MSKIVHCRIMVQSKKTRLLNNDRVDLAGAQVADEGRAIVDKPNLSKQVLLSGALVGHQSRRQAAHQATYELETEPSSQYMTRSHLYVDQPSYRRRALNDSIERDRIWRGGGAIRPIERKSKHSSKR